MLFAGEIKSALDGLAGAPHKSGMAIEILSSQEIERMRRAGRAAAETLAFVGSQLRPGMSTATSIVWCARTPRDGVVGPASLATTASRPRSAPAEITSSATASPARTSFAARRYPQRRHHDQRRWLPRRHQRDVSDRRGQQRGAPHRRHRQAAARPASQSSARVHAWGDIGAAIVEIAAAEGVGVVTEIGGHGIGRTMHADPTYRTSAGRAPGLACGLA